MTWAVIAATLIDPATPEEIAQIERLLISLGGQDWRHAEALSVLGSPDRRPVLRMAFESGNI
jgi:hypothetical protein